MAIKTSFKDNGDTFQVRLMKADSGQICLVVTNTIETRVVVLGVVTAGKFEQQQLGANWVVDSPTSLLEHFTELNSGAEITITQL